ncbi:Thioesterase superfamily protein [Thalictrum thalictroides]|uniref:Thioesterase superfamily protein n=1 Tax=Thalictrum thalictroides TaxID=46969 RepID=A0A7J6W670_THATH|nr:Thioesterase superfamily protein [Thalictrum thalictroides]
MEISAVSNSLISSISSQPRLSNRTIANVFLPSNQQRAYYSRISVSNSRSFFSSLNLINRSNNVIRCSANGAEDSQKQIPMEQRFEAFPTKMDIDKILEILPHRFPFLLVDRVVDRIQSWSY